MTTVDYNTAVISLSSWTSRHKPRYVWIINNDVWLQVLCIKFMYMIKHSNMAKWQPFCLCKSDGVFFLWAFWAPGCFRNVCFYHRWCLYVQPKCFTNHKSIIPITLKKKENQMYSLKLICILISILNINYIRKYYLILLWPWKYQWNTSVLFCLL